MEDLAGTWLAATYAAELNLDAELKPDDPEGLILTAAWVPVDDALERLGEGRAVRRWTAARVPHR
jgi:hypothetical protein